MESLVQNNVNSIRTIDTDSKEMLMQLFTLIDNSFNWEFTSSKRKHIKSIKLLTIEALAVILMAFQNKRNSLKNYFCKTCY